MKLFNKIKQAASTASETVVSDPFEFKSTVCQINNGTLQCDVTQSMRKGDKVKGTTFTYETGFYKEMLDPVWAKLIYLAFSLVIVVVCASDPVVKVFKKILEPNIDINKITDYFKNKEISQ